MIAAVLATAIAAAGCGSGTAGKSRAASLPTTTPAPPPTPTTGTATGSTPTSPLPSKLHASTAIDSPEVRAAIIKQLAAISGIPAKDDAPIADCLISKLRAAHIRTYGDANRRITEVTSATRTCTSQVLSAR